MSASRRLATAVGGALVAGALAFTGSASAVTWSVSMSGAKQTASGIPGDPNGTGSASITGYPSQNRLCATVSWSNIAQPVVAGHIHEGAAGQPENPAWTINLFGPNINGTSNPVSACTTVTAQQINAMNKTPWLFNVVVHNQAYPAGAIRGQLGPGGLCQVLDVCVDPPPPPTGA